SVLGGLHIGPAPVLDQAHSLKLELASKLPSLHDPPPVPSKHLTRCLRNRVQARQTKCSVGGTSGSRPNRSHASGGEEWVPLSGGCAVRHQRTGNRSRYVA